MAISQGPSTSTEYRLAVCALLHQAEFLRPSRCCRTKEETRARAHRRRRARWHQRRRHMQLVLNIRNGGLTRPNSEGVVVDGTDPSDQRPQGIQKEFRCSTYMIRRPPPSTEELIRDGGPHVTAMTTADGSGPAMGTHKAMHGQSAAARYPIRRTLRQAQRFPPPMRYLTGSVRLCQIRKYLISWGNSPMRCVPEREPKAPWGGRGWGANRSAPAGRVPAGRVGRGPARASQRTCHVRRRCRQIRRSGLYTYGCARRETLPMWGTTAKDAVTLIHAR